MSRLGPALLRCALAAGLALWCCSVPACDRGAGSGSPAQAGGGSASTAATSVAVQPAVPSGSVPTGAALASQGRILLRDPGPEQQRGLGEPTLPDAPSAGPPPAGWPSFTDVSAALGLRFTRFSGATGRKHYCEPKGGGIAFLDADGDGWVDLYVVDGGKLPGYEGDHRRANRLFRNVQGQRFEDVTERAGVSGGWYDMGAAVGDYDGDGRDDLYVTGIDGTILYRNRGDGTFEDVTAQTGSKVPGWSSSALFVDLDEDGFLDLYVVRYLDYHPRSNPPCYATGIHNYCTPHDFPPLTDVILRNVQGQRFEDVTRQLGGSLPAAPGLMAAPGDFDGDGHVDVYVANDEIANLLLVNDGKGKLADNALLAGVAVGPSGFPEAGMGVDVGDVDGDGLLDLVVGNFADQPVNYFRNAGHGLFVEESARSGIFAPTYHPLEFGVRLLDLDNDGDLDLFVCNGHIWDTVATFQPGVEFAQQNTVMRNRGDGTFEDLSSRSGPGLLLKRASRGLASADFDQDGDLDLAYLNQDSPAVLLRNEGGNGNPWVRVRLVGLPPNTAAVGAKVALHAGGRVQVRQVTTAGGYQSANEATLHFGLGEAGRAERLIVHWPPPQRGTTELAAPESGQVVVVRQPP